MYRGIDCATPISAKAAEILKAEGFEFICRYLVPPVSYSKALTRAEAERICAAGLRILCVWETTASRMKQGAAAGREDGKRAYQLAEEMGIPTNAILYFAADYDALPEDMPSIRGYLWAAMEEIRPYQVGIYGSYRVMEEMKNTAIRGFWQCVAWSGGRVSDAMTVYQAQWQGTAECQALAAKVGFYVDIDECPDMQRAGMWSYHSEPVPKTGGMADAERYNSVAELPKWAEPTIRKLIARGCLKGNGGARDAEGLPADLDLSHDMVRMLVILDRAGLFDPAG